MFLRRLVIENARSIEHLDMPFAADGGEAAGGRKWSLVLGENGCGKSTILRAIALLLAGSDALPELLGDIDSWITLGKERCTLRAELATASGEDRHISLELQRGDTIRAVFDRNRAALDDLDRALAHADRNYFTVGYGVSRRLSAEPTTAVASATSPFRTMRAQSVATLFWADATLNPLETWAMDLEYRRGARGLQTVREALAGLLPGIELDRIDREQRRLLFKTADGTLPLSALSDGYQNVAAWVGDLLYRLTQTFHDRKRPLEARGLLLIDEIDLHLHSVWKRRLTEFLTAKLPNFQIVATTHSPLTAHQAGPNELFLLRRDEPNGPPHLYQFQGEPRTLMLHQLLLTPIFGVGTVDSLKVEQDRSRYRALQAQTTRTRSEERELSRLRVELENLPDWSTESPSEARQRELLEQIDRALALANGTAGPASASASTSAATPTRRARATRSRQTAPSAPPLTETQPRETLGSGRGALVRLS